jgi:hypothetical protein
MTSPYLRVSALIAGWPPRVIWWPVFFAILDAVQVDQAQTVKKGVE